MTSLLNRPIVPVVSQEDAEVTYEALRPYLLESGFTPIVVHVIEKAGGAPDKASVEQRKEYAERIFNVFRKRAEIDRIEIETELLYGTDIAATIHQAADEFDASAIVFRSRGNGGWLDRLSGNVRTNLIATPDHPIIVLPETGESQ